MSKLHKVKMTGERLMNNLFISLMYSRCRMERLEVLGRPNWDNKVTTHYKSIMWRGG